MIKTKHMAAYPKRYTAFFLSADKRHKLPADPLKCSATLREFENWVHRMVGRKGIPFKDEDARNKFKGDALELLAELFFLAFQNDPKVGLREYTPVPIDEDYGMDAQGKNANGDRAGVQVKFRSNHGDKSTYPTYSEIARTFTSGVCQFGVDPSKDSVVFVFTNADNLGSNCAKVLGNKLVVVNRAIIQHFIDNNKHFWRMASKEVLAYLQYHLKGKVTK